MSKIRKGWKEYEEAIKKIDVDMQLLKDMRETTTYDDNRLKRIYQKVFKDVYKSLDKIDIIPRKDKEEIKDCTDFIIENSFKITEPDYTEDMIEWWLKIGKSTYNRNDDGYSNSMYGLFSLTLLYDDIEIEGVE